MSLSSLATNAIQKDIRVKQFSDQQKIKRIIRAMVAEQINSPAKALESLEADARENASTEDVAPGKPDSNILESLVKYIPTEIITLYLAAISAHGALQSIFPKLTITDSYRLFAFATPVVFLVIWLGKRRSAGLKLSPPIKEWPIWRSIASTIAFLVWALAIPDGSAPEANSSLEGAAFAFLALVVSTGLSLCDPLFVSKGSSGA